MSNWLSKLLPPKIKRDHGKHRGAPEGLWSKCPECDEVLNTADLEKNAKVCPKCNFHLRLCAKARLEMLLDDEKAEIIANNIASIDPLKFKDSKKYTERLKAAAAASDEDEAIRVVKGFICGIPVVIAAFEFDFMGGSMGSVLGERFVRGVNLAIAERLPFISVAASGGARMQEGLFSLMQMAKTTAVLTKLSAAKLPYISVLTNPTMGGVSASFAFMGDIVLAEPGALVGFAGPRVIEQTVRQTLPEGFQRSEFLLEKGAIDLIVDRRELKTKIASLLKLLQKTPS